MYKYKTELKFSVNDEKCIWTLICDDIRLKSDKFNHDGDSLYYAFRYLHTLNLARRKKLDSTMKNFDMFINETDSYIMIKDEKSGEMMKHMVNFKLKDNKIKIYIMGDLYSEKGYDHQKVLSGLKKFQITQHMNILLMCRTIYEVDEMDGVTDVNFSSAGDNAW
jgi:hypothetical protein